MHNLIYFLLFILFNFCLNVFIIPFETYPKQDNVSFIKYIFNNDLFSEIYLCSPPQKIITDIRFDTYSFLISNGSLNSSFNETLSSSFKLNSSISLILEYRYLTYKSYPACDNLIINNQYNNYEVKNFPFVFGVHTSNNPDNYNFNCIGLQISKYNFNDDKNFIEQLKKHKKINSYAFNIVYLTNNNGIIIIGEYPHEYNSTIYKKENFNYVHTGYEMGKILWKIKFDKVYYYNDFNDKIKDAIFNINAGTIIASKNYHEIIYNNFFKELIEKNICFKSEIFNNNYFNYYCNLDVDISKFESIYFYHKEFNFTFELDYKDLFIKNENFYYFLVSFDIYSNYEWIFGKPFFKKYNFVFDQDKKILGLYLEKERKYLANENNKFLLLICLILLLLIIIILLLFMLKKVYKKKYKNKIHSNETSFDDKNYINLKTFNQ
jgi:hypothetical protein